MASYNPPPPSPSQPRDPFASLDEPRTFIKPRPGGGGAPPAQPAPRPDGTATMVMQDAPPPQHGLNPLLAVANPLLMLVPQVRATRQADPATVRASLAHAVREFVAQAQEKGIAPERVMAARYVLCTMLDEAAADTPWGGGGVWGRFSLLAEFHNEVFGGEKVFQLMARLAEKPDVNLDLLELIYAATALGFEGRYRVIDNGRAQLESVRTRLAQIIRQQRGGYPAALAEHWQGAQVSEKRGLTWMPLALAAAAVALLLGLIYAAFAWSLAGKADPVYGQVQGLRLSPPVAPVAQPAAAPRLAGLLDPDVRAGTIAVRDEADRSVVTVRGDGLFAPGSATLMPERVALMQRIASAMQQNGGAVLITGHTDNQAIRTLRFPSNWHLSEERARTVRDMFVSTGIPADRVKAEGRADGEPVTSNDTPDGRSKNRRVEVTLFPGKGQALTTSAAAPAAPAASR